MSDGGGLVLTTIGRQVASRDYEFNRLNNSEGMDALESIKVSSRGKRRGVVVGGIQVSFFFSCQFFFKHKSCYFGICIGYDNVLLSPSRVDHHVHNWEKKNASTPKD